MMRCRDGPAAPRRCRAARDAEAASATPEYPGIPAAVFTQTRCSHTSTEAGDGSADEEGVDLAGALVKVDRLASALRRRGARLRSLREWRGQGGAPRSQR